MVVYHVTTPKKYLQAIKTGYIKGPVEAWRDLHWADLDSCRNSKSVILRLKFPEDAEVVMNRYGDSGLRVLHGDYVLDDQLKPSKKMLR